MQPRTVTRHKPSETFFGGKTAPELATEAASILVFALSLFTLLSLWTYSPGDPSLFTNVRGIPLNACGRVGAYLSSLLLQTFGLGGFLVPAALFFVATTVFKREGWVRLLGILSGMTVAVLSAAVFLTLQWKFWPYAGTLLLTGGAVGTWMASLLARDLNPVGASLVSLVVFALALALSTPLSVARMGATVLRVCGQFLGGAVRLVGSYLLYIGGLILVRVAQTVGDLAQRGADAIVDGARAKLREVKQNRAERALLRRAEEEARQAELKEAARALPAVLKGASSPAGQAGESDEADSETNTPADAAFDDHSEEPTQQDEISAEATSKAKQEKLPFQVYARESTNSANASTAAASRLSERALKAANAKRGNWKLPTVEFLRKPPQIASAVDRERLVENSEILVQKFSDFTIDGEVTAVRPGPVITLYEFKPGPGVKVSRIQSLQDDLSMALSAQSVRILAPIPGKSVVGIEIPNEQRETVFLREFLQHPDFYGTKHAIPIVMGKDIAGQPVLSDLARMPHLLCAGQTGAGKSVFMNGLICSLFYRFTPDELRVILVDPKFIEFRAYQDSPHLLLPVVDDPKHASSALKWAVREMDRRYRILGKLGVRNLAGYNQKVEEMGDEVVHDLLFSEENQSEQTSSPGSDWMESFDLDEAGAPRVGKLPYIVIIIDELADLMMVARKEVEISIARIAQKARAAGIHLVIATQRPSTDVVTGLIKANLPSRVSFQLASFVDSKTILDRAGAERLLGQGDMLFVPPGSSQPIRLHGAFVDDAEIEKITAFLRSQGKPVYRDEIVLDEEEDSFDSDAEDEQDPLFEDAMDLVKRSGHASASFLQRHLKIGYNRAARMIETMESRGIVGPADGARPREVLIR